MTISKRFAALASIVFFLVPALSLAQTANTLQQQINSNNTQIDQLNTEISQYQTQLKTISAKKTTLQSTINTINLNIKKTMAQVTVLQNQISSSQIQIQQLAGQISSAQDSINGDTAGLKQSLQLLYEEESRPLALQMLSSESIISIWNDISVLSIIQNAVKNHIVDLENAKKSYSTAKSATENKQTQLLNQQENLRQQQGSLSAQKLTQNNILKQTKSQESNFQSIIAQKKAQATQLQAALTDLKSQYNQVVNPSSYPQPSPGLFTWPIVGQITVTQYFGDTPFAQSHAPLYSGHGHDGLDIAASIGTPVHAALSGSVLATGNTDATITAKGQCYSFGKWIMLKHANGLNTMYAHLSEIDVSPGQNVSTGQEIGYSGETGYATGPHLHFGVYVSAVTQIIRLGQATNGTSPCASAVMPVPPVSGYLNPLNYLPATNFIDSTGQ